MAYGYCGKLLEVDLTSRTYKTVPVDEGDMKKFLGGSGLGAKILYTDYDYKKPALSPDNPLMFMVGLLIGLPVPAAAKMTVVGKSPLTGIWGESIVGGFLGPEIKKAGYDGIIFKGKSEKPVAVFIKNEEVQFIDAAHLWGKDVYETDKILRNQTDEKAETACIGPAGERLVPIASIMVGGQETRAAGRCGFGCLMGYKNLKAIAVRGTKPVPIYDKEKLSSYVREFNPVLMKNAQVLHDYGTLGTIQGVESEGDLPIKNWTLGSWEEGAAKISGQMLAQTCQTGHYACFSCPVRCGKIAEVRVGPFKGTIGHGPEYETGAAFGSNILNDNLDYICAVNDICNRYGIDTIEAGNVVAMAIECFENGLLTLKDTDGIELKWGMTEGLIPLVQKIALKEGIGEVLGKGVRKAAEEIGGLAKEFAIETKGLSYAMHDPRAYTTMVANYATANKGASHLEALGYFSEGGAYPAECVGFTKKTEPHGYEGKGEYAARLQDLMNLFDALGLCKFIMLGHITHEIMKNWINAATGWNLTAKDVALIGERLFNLKRMYNVRLGISRKDDTIPPRLLMHDKKTGAAAGSIPHYPRIIHDYYEYRGWNNEGIPTAEKLEQLGLKEIVKA
ncbi:MAG: aldehyde:ferredoxin oxidoreductase [Clostridiales bacterium]|jgi:aldehyde:ferredoxin oxidoreductase|nr:aldehyde:ferredoxin oxidoreductase [Clostridiales bacterium]